MLRLTILLVALMGTVACSTRQAGPRQDPNVITEAQITASQLRDAYEVVQALRPEFLRTRGTVSFRATDPVKPVVYVDGVRMGDPETMRRVPWEVLREIRYIDAREATTRYGTGHGSGAILVATKRAAD